MNYEGNKFRLVTSRDADGDVEGWELTGRRADGLFHWCDYFTMEADREQFLKWARERGVQVEEVGGDE